LNLKKVVRLKQLAETMCSRAERIQSLVCNGANARPPSELLKGMRRVILNCGVGDSMGDLAAFRRHIYKFGEANLEVSIGIF